MENRLVKTCLFVLCVFSTQYVKIETNSADDRQTDDSFGHCECTDNGVKCQPGTDFNLTRLENGEVGRTEHIVLDDNTVLDMKTLSVKPVIFEIPNFLSDKECQHFIDVARKEGLKNSKTEKQESGDQGFQLLDKNQDKRLSLKEMATTIENGFDIYLEDEDIVEMYQELNIDTNGDTYITPDEINKVSPAEMKIYLAKLISKQPEKHSRYSKQVWLFPDQSTDEVFATVQEKVSKVVKLPMDLIKLSDFQVVNYDVNGHYNAHYDSTKIDTSVPCCDRGRTRKCRICRYLTVLFYLNEVDDGGETAFPVANNDTVDVEVLHNDRVGHLFKKCGDANLRVSAEKGKAIIWYNHFIDPLTGWMGEMDRYTFHGGCPVSKGEKWIANFWIKTTEDKAADMARIRKLYSKK